MFAEFADISVLSSQHSLSTSELIKAISSSLDKTYADKSPTFALNSLRSRRRLSVRLLSSSFVRSYIIN